MEVTRENFKTVLDSLPDVFRRAQFLAIDTEFTGLNVKGSSNLNYFDTLEDLYLLSKLKADTFMAIQFGLVAFFHDNETNKYTHQGYNFYVYPSTYSNVNFTCQSRSIQFLIEHGFDFNKLFASGIPYIRESEAGFLIDKLKEKFDKPSSQYRQITEIPNEQKDTVNSIIKRVQEVINKGVKTSFNIEKHNSFVRRLIYGSLQQKFGADVFVETNNDETLTISFGFSAEELNEKKKQKFSKEKDKILDEIGFSKVIKLITESNKLLIGHNFLLDILFTIRQFYAPLPQSYKEFTEMVRFLFPKLLDTKYMAASIMKNIKDTALANLLQHFEEINEIPVVEIAENGLGYAIEDKKLHEASYDAYLTGLCFLAMSKSSGDSNGVSNIFNNLPESPILKPVVNKLATPRLYNISFMNVCDCDYEPDRSGVYHLTLPPEWLEKDIIELFKNCSFTNISWINNNSAYIRVKKECIPEVEKNLMIENSVYKLLPFKDFKKSTSFTPDPLLCSDKNPGKSEENSKSITSPLKLVLDSPMVRKRKVEDVGEVIERQPKKACPSK